MIRPEDLVSIWRAALAAVDPREAVLRALRLEGNILRAGEISYDLTRFERVIVIGAGKATARMARAAEDILADRINEGVIIVKYGHTAGLGRIRQVEAGHPLPDAAGVEGTRRVLQLAGNADERTLVLCLLSGGGSSLLVAPAEGLSLQEKQSTTSLLLKAGAPIDEVNAVRKHLSAVKGGMLARAVFPATLAALVLSDVIGDRLDVIASGPTAPDSTTFRDAAQVLERYGLRASLPPRVVARIDRGVAGQEPETAKSGEACFSRTRNIIIGGLGQALAAARDKALSLGFSAEIMDAELQGEARMAAAKLARKAREALQGMRPGERRCLLFGGETTVMISGRGTGGRNQELALAFALEIAGAEGISLLSAGTDGTDGPTDAAGALVDGGTADEAREHGLAPGDHLANNDSYTFFQRLDAAAGTHSHFKTGPTGTNVMDMQIILLER